jgi:hypothetical protein
MDFLESIFLSEEKPFWLDRWFFYASYEGMKAKHKKGFFFFVKSYMDFLESILLSEEKPF